MRDAQREEWLSVKEFAALRRVSPQTVYAAIRRGLLPQHHERVGGTIRIHVPRESIKDSKAS